MIRAIAPNSERRVPIHTGMARCTAPTIETEQKASSVDPRNLFIPIPLRRSLSKPEAIPEAEPLESGGTYPELDNQQFLALGSLPSECPTVVRSGGVSGGPIEC